LPACIGEHLVHRTHGETALQRRIGVGMPKRRPPGVPASPCASMRSILPRKIASVLVRAPIIARRSSGSVWAVTGSFRSEPAAGTFVHGMF
jgi:hypothetical protein